MLKFLYFIITFFILFFINKLLNIGTLGIRSFNHIKNLIFYYKSFFFINKLLSVDTRGIKLKFFFPRDNNFINPYYNIFIHVRGKK